MRYVVAALASTLLLTGCATGPDLAPSSPSAPVTSSAAPEVVAPAAETPAPAAGPVPAAPPSTDGRPRAATLAIPALGLRDVPITPYAGTPDDRAGTAIQDDGALAAPYGSGGLVGPGGTGNFLVTGHRTSANRPFAELPTLPIGARVVVETRTEHLVYEIVRDQRTSFRSPASLRAQSAAVPGHPDRVATRAMITLSTCATAEDHAAGNYWADEFHNPEHRLEKVGVLRSVLPL